MCEVSELLTHTDTDRVNSRHTYIPAVRPDNVQRRVTAATCLYISRHSCNSVTITAVSKTLSVHNRTITAVSSTLSVDNRAIVAVSSTLSVDNRTIMAVSSTLSVDNRTIMAASRLSVDGL